MNTYTTVLNTLTQGTKPTIESLTTALFEMAIKLDAAQSTTPLIEAKHVPGARNYGPKSISKMTDELAYSIRYGHYKDSSVNEIAKAEGLSRGQIYSVKGNYTFRHVNEEFVNETDDAMMDDLEARIVDDSDTSS